MNYFNAYFIDVLKKRYVQFYGRAPRREFWYFILFSIIGRLLLSIIDGIVGLTFILGIDPQGTPVQVGILSMLFSLGLILPSIAIAIRRLHDIGKSGWWYLLAIIPFVNVIGIFVLIYFFITPSQQGDNRYGSFPFE